MLYWGLFSILLIESVLCFQHQRMEVPFHSKFRHNALTNSDSRSIPSNSLGFMEMTTAFKLPKILAVIPCMESVSPYEKKPEGCNSAVPWLDVLTKVSEKIGYEARNDKYNNSGLELSMEILALDQIDESVSFEQVDILLLIDLHNDSKANHVSQLAGQVGTPSTAVVGTFNCSNTYMQLQRYGTFSPPDPLSLLQEDTAGLITQFQNWLRNRMDDPISKKHALAYDIAQDMWRRQSFDDLIFMIFVLVDSFMPEFPIKSVKSVTSTESTKPSQVVKMCSKCSKEMIDCFSNPTCRAALDCLNGCKGNDQVCSYRCITSHETPAFENFAKCILQRHNCMGNYASVPVFPDPQPMTHFRGKTLDHETAEEIFIGMLDLSEQPIQDEERQQLKAQLLSARTNPLLQKTEQKLQKWSWKVVCGQNPAYDYFASQHQLFYRDANRKSVMWYDPVFKVTTFDGEEVWRRRHYRVRRGKLPGQFYFSVLDNGVASNEFWRILDCADDLSWAVFYYSGAASAAGTSYTGSLLVSPDGSWPVMTPETSQQIEHAFARGGVSMWELYEVNNTYTVNDAVNPPPLSLVLNE